MKLIAKTAILFLVMFLGFTTANAQFSVGIKDSRYVYGAYRLANGIDFKLDHSLYSEKMGFQRVGLHIGYERSLPYGLGVEADLSGATVWNGNYQVVSCELSLNYRIHGFGVEATVDPRYDSGMKYDTCWRLGLSQQLTRPIAVTLQYTTIPVYRMSEKRIDGGFVFKVDNLTVAPALSVSAQKETRFKNMRVQMSMNYQF